MNSAQTFTVRRQPAKPHNPREPSVTDACTPAQLEHGYLRIANSLFDAWLLAAPRLTKHQSHAFMAIVRHTYGWGRKTAPMTAATISSMTGLDPSDCRKAISRLSADGLIVVEHRGKKSQILGPQKDPALWFGGGEHPGKSGVNPPGKYQKAGENTPEKRGEVPRDGKHAGENTPGKAGENTPEKRGEVPRQNPLEATEHAASSDPKDRKDKVKTTTTHHPSGGSARVNVSVDLMLASLAGLTEPVARDYLAYRRAKRAPLTATAWKTIVRAVREIGEAPDDVLAYAMSAGWQGLNATWWENAHRRQNPTSRTQFADQDYEAGLAGFATSMGD